MHLVPHPVENSALKRAIEMVMDGAILTHIADFWKTDQASRPQEILVHGATIYRFNLLA